MYAFSTVKSIVSSVLFFSSFDQFEGLSFLRFCLAIQARHCNDCSLDDIIPVYVYLRCCLKLGLHSIILNDYASLDARFVIAGASSHPIVLMCKVHLCL
jgi:hypothetical protein